MLKRSALDLPLCCDRTNRELIDVDDELGDVDMISDDSSMEVEIVENVAMEVDDVEEKAEKENEVSLEVVNLENGSLMMDDDDDTQANEKSSVVSNRPVTDVWSFEAYRKILKSAENRTSKLKGRGFGDVLKERCRAVLRSLRSLWQQDEEEPVEVGIFSFMLCDMNRLIPFDFVKSGVSLFFNWFAGCTT